LFMAIILMAGFATEIFSEITLLNSVKIAKWPVWLKAAFRICYVALAVAELVATVATKGFTQRRIDL